LRIPQAIVALLVASLAACAARVVAPPPVEGLWPAGFPDAYYRELEARGQNVLRVDTARSLVVIEVRRGGSLARFGHDHVLASRDVSGYVAPEEGRADLRVPLDTLIVDDPALRTQAGLDTTPSAEDIAGTRRNMLERVLETQRYPDVLVAVNGVEPGAGARRLSGSVTLHGTTVPIEAVAQVDRAQDEISVTGTMTLEQSRFGIEPFSILGGAIAVQDRLTLQFRIRAYRVR
jgi:hypothetical protein